MAINCKIYTPYNIVKELLLLCGYKGKKILKRHVIDNSCGHAAILEQIVEEYIKCSKRQNVSNEVIKKDLETYIHGFDIDEEAITISKINLQKIADKYNLLDVNWNIKLQNYLDYKDEIKYDYIICNPPYISYYDMEEKNRVELKKFMSCKFGKYDYYYAFIEKAIETMQINACMTYIIPNSFLKNDSGRKLREIIKPFLTDIIDLSGYKIFDDVLVSTCMIKLVNKKSSVLNYTIKIKENYKKLDKSLIKDKYLFDMKVDLKNKKFGACYNVFSSVATLLNKAFILDKKLNNEINYKEDIIRKAASPKYLSKNKEQFIIFPYSYNIKGELSRFTESDLKDKFPTSYKHLLKFKSDLEKTDKDANANFFEYGRSQALKKLYQEKLLISTLVTKNVNVYVLDKKTIPYSGLVITQKNKNYSLEQAKDILESKEFLEYIENVAVSANGVTKRISSKDVENFYIGDDQ